MRITLILISFLFSTCLFSQKILQIERLHSPKTKKYFPGNEITFQTKDGQWYTRIVEDLNYDNNWLIFTDGHIALDEIVSVKTFKNKGWSQGLGTRLMLFAPVWAAYTGIATALDDGDGEGGKFKFQKSDYVIMGSALASGLVLRTIFKSRTYKVIKNGKPSTKFRLRILDLTVK